MTVGELRELLEAFAPDAPIVGSFDGGFGKCEDLEVEERSADDYWYEYAIWIHINN